jgi:coenzyme Q-binding protein COQ10
MPKFETERRVAHSADDMFALIADVERYPEFVPLCQRLIIKARNVEGGRDILVADMTVAYKIIRETFTTRVTLDRAARTVDAQYLNGPFKHLDSRWSFTPEGEGACIVRFTIDYAFKSRALAAVMGAVFDTAFRKFAAAFETRADVIYGKAAPA